MPIISTGKIIGTIDLESKKVSIENSNLISFSCDSRVDCCSNLKIPLTDFDIDRIQNNGYELDQIISSYSPVLLPSKTYNGKTEKVYTVKRKPFDGTCTFLKDNLCQIHEYKPFACQIYPFSLEIVDENKINILIHADVLCKSIIPSTLKDSNNLDLLKSILDNVIAELEERNIPIN